MNTKNDLNSALALFRSLYQAQKGDIYTIIERFILVGVKSKGLMSFSKEEIANLLKEMFNLDIPFSVIQKCIVSNQNVFRYSREKYVVINSMDEEIDSIIEEMNEKNRQKETFENSENKRNKGNDENGENYEGKVSNVSEKNKEKYGKSNNNLNLCNHSPSKNHHLK